MFPIKTIMTSDVVTVMPSTPIYDAMKILLNYKISGVPVVDEEKKLVGILTERDLLDIFLHKQTDSKQTVNDYMTKDVKSFPEETDAFTICQFFLDTPIRRVPVVNDEGKLSGIVSRRDIVAAILRIEGKLSDIDVDEEETAE